MAVGAASCFSEAFFTSVSFTIRAMVQALVAERLFTATAPGQAPVTELFAADGAAEAAVPAE